MLRKICVLMIALLVLNGSVISVDAALPDELEAIYQTMQDADKRSVSDNVSTYIAEQKTDGSWADVSYDRIMNGRAHLARLNQIAIAYKQSRHALCGKQEALNAVENGLSCWIAKLHAGMTDTNFWERDIAQQMDLWSVLRYVCDDIDAKLLSDTLKIFVDWEEIVENNGQASTGTNLYWVAEQSVQKGLINRSNEEVLHGLEGIGRVIEISENEGIKSDYSFHQHDNQLYNNGYGMDFFLGVVNWIGVFENTSYEFDAAKKDVICDLFLHGNLWMQRDDYLDLNAAGREITRKQNRMPNYKYIAGRLLAACPDRRADIIAACGNENTVTGNGNRYFHKSNYIAHHREKYFMSVGGSSSFVVGTEQGSGENIGGKWTAFGFSSVFLNSDDYYNIYPFWDWSKIPGVTAPNRVDEYSLSGRAVKNASPNVAGCSDGNNGFMTMEVNIMPDSNKTDTTTAQKAWFMFDDETVSLGSGIKSTAEENVLTTIEQKAYDGAFSVDNEVASAGIFRNVGRMHHGNIGYIFPNTEDINITTEKRSNSWKGLSSINGDSTMMSKDIFTAYIDHGKAPVDGAYAYITVPAVSEEEFASYHNPIRVLSNTAGLQAVCNEEDGLSQIAFYDLSDNTVNVGNGVEISVSKRCLVMFRESESGYVVSAAPIGMDYGVVEIEIRKNGSVLSAKLQLTNGETVTRVISGDSGAQTVGNARIIAKNGILDSGAVLIPQYDYFGETAEKTDLVWESSATGESGSWTAITAADNAGRKYRQIYHDITSVTAEKASLKLSPHEGDKYIRYHLICNGSDYYSEATPLVENIGLNIKCDNDEYKTNSVLTADIGGVDTDSELVWQWAWTKDAPDTAWHTIENSTNKLKLYLTQAFAGKYIRFRYTDAAGERFSTVTPAIEYEHNLVHTDAITSLSGRYDGLVKKQDGYYLVYLDSANAEHRGYIGVGDTIPDANTQEADNSNAYVGMYASLDVKRFGTGKNDVPLGIRIGKGSSHSVYDSWVSYGRLVSKEWQTFSNPYLIQNSQQEPVAGDAWFDFCEIAGISATAFEDAEKIGVKNIFLSKSAPYIRKIGLTGSASPQKTITAVWTKGNEYAVFWRGGGKEYKRTKDISSYKWYIAENAYGDENGNWTEIPGAAERTLTLTDDMADKYIRVEVTPGSSAGNLTNGEEILTSRAYGVPVSSAPMRIKHTGVTFTGAVAAGNTLSGTVYINNESGMEGGYMALIAVYNDGALCACEGVRFNILNTDADAERNFSVTIPAGVAGNLTVKTFLWSDDLVPVR